MGKHPAPPPPLIKYHPERPGQFCIQKQRRFRINCLPQTGNVYEIMRLDLTETVYQGTVCLAYYFTERWLTIVEPSVSVR